MGSHGDDDSNKQKMSIYSLTLDEVEHHLGEPLSSMNLDDLLKSVCSIEENNEIAVHQTAIEPLLSKKTVDEVWRDIQQRDFNGSKALDRQATLGEITLEEFLMKAGVVVESAGAISHANTKNNPANVPAIETPNYNPHWVQCPLPQYQQQPVLGTFLGAGSLMDVPFSDNALALATPMIGAACEPQAPLRKRIIPEDMIERTVERRQKRMIKNRESAARSRARKQAYTNELEIKVSRLEEENEMLRKQKELESALPSALLPEPKFQLRRTSSSPF